MVEARGRPLDARYSLTPGMADTDAHYPLQSGIRDVIAYYYAGSLTDAMLGLVEKTGADAQVNRANAAAARRSLQSSH